MRSAAVEALAARVRFTCAAYLPISRFVLSVAAAKHPSSSGRFDEAKSQDDVCSLCVASSAAAGGGDLRNQYDKAHSTGTPQSAASTQKNYTPLETNLLSRAPSTRDRHPPLQTNLVTSAVLKKNKHQPLETHSVSSAASTIDRHLPRWRHSMSPAGSRDRRHLALERGILSLPLLSSDRHLPLELEGEAAFRGKRSALVLRSEVPSSGTPPALKTVGIPADVTRTPLPVERLSACPGGSTRGRHLRLEEGFVRGATSTRDARPRQEGGSPSYAVSRRDRQSPLETELATPATSGERQLPLEDVLISASILRDIHTVLVVPASSWVRRACRSFVRGALAEGGLPLLERPQSPVSLTDVILSQWEALLLKGEYICRRNKLFLPPVKAGEVCEKKNSCCSAGVPKPDEARKAACGRGLEGDLAAVVVRSLGESIDVAKSLGTAAEAVRQQIRRVDASRWQLPPAEWRACATKVAGERKTKMQAMVVRQAAGTGVQYCKSGQYDDINSSPSVDTWCSASPHSGDGECCRNNHVVDLRVGRRGKQAGSEKRRAAEGRAMEFVLKEEKLAANKKMVVRDVVTGRPLLQSELQNILKARQRPRSRPDDDPWRQYLPFTGPDVRFPELYNREAALRIVQRGIKSLELQERVRQAALIATQGDTCLSKEGAIAHRTSATIHQSRTFRKNDGSLTNDTTKVRSKEVASPETLVPYTTAGETESLLEAAVMKLYLAFRSNEESLTKGKGRWRELRAQAPSDLPLPDLCLPTSAWRLVHPAAVRSWKRLALPAAVLYVRALARKQKTFRLRKQHSDTGVKAVPAYSRLQRGLSQQGPSQQASRRHQQKPQRHLRADGQKGKTIPVDRAGVPPGREGQEGGVGNCAKRARKIAGNWSSVIVGRQHRECGSSLIAAHSPPAVLPATTADLLREETIRQTQERCRTDFLLLRDTQETQLTLRVLVSAKECRERAASERAAIETLLSAIRQGSQ